MPSEPNTPRSANALADLAMKYAGDAPAKIREFNEDLPTAAVDAGRAIFSKLPPELQKGLSDAASAGGDALHQMVTHVASSPVGQAIGAGLEGIDIATEPLQENYAASQQMMKDMGVQAPSMIDNPLFDFADVGPLGNVGKGNYRRLFHAGSDPLEGGVFEKVPKGGVFDGFFALDTGYGPYGTGAKYYADVDDSKILRDFDLNYEIP